MIQQETLKKIRMVFSDIDGTVLNSKGKLTDRTKSAVYRLAQKGIPFILVSARPPQGISCFYQEFGVSAPICAYSGGYLAEGKKLLINRTLPLDAAGLICRQAETAGIHASVYHLDHWYVQQLDDAARWEADAIGFEPEQEQYTRLFERFEKSGQAPNKILCIGNAAEIACFQQKVAEQYGSQLNCCLSKDTYLEIMPKQVTKADAIRALCIRRGLKQDQIMAFGDHYNDLEMLKYAGVGVAVENAPDEIKAAADLVSSSNDRDGVAAVLEQLLQK